MFYYISNYHQVLPLCFLSNSHRDFFHNILTVYHHNTKYYIAVIQIFSYLDGKIIFLKYLIFFMTPHTRIIPTLLLNNSHPLI